MQLASPQSPALHHLFFQFAFKFNWGRPRLYESALLIVFYAEHGSLMQFLNTIAWVSRCGAIGIHASWQRGVPPKLQEWAGLAMLQHFLLPTSKANKLGLNGNLWALLDRHRSVDNINMHTPQFPNENVPAIGFKSTISRTKWSSRN